MEPILIFSKYQEDNRNLFINDQKKAVFVQFIAFTPDKGFWFSLSL
jgi:hypothetical protein